MTFDFVAWAGIIGALLPSLVSLIKRQGWSMTQKRVAAFILSLVAAVVYTGVQEGWTTITLDQLVAAMTTIFVVAQTTYDHLWSGTAVEKKIAMLGSG